MLESRSIYTPDFSSLLSFIPPSCMVVPNREFANIKSSFHTSAMHHSLEVNAISEDVNMDEPRGRSKSSTRNPSRESSVISNLSSVPYVNRMKAQSDEPSWANQTEMKNFQLSYTSPKEGESNVQYEANGSKDMHPPTCGERGY